jgi:hypothetical protein
MDPGEVTVGAEARSCLVPLRRPQSFKDELLSRWRQYIVVGGRVVADSVAKAPQDNVEGHGVNAAPLGQGGFALPECVVAVPVLDRVATCDQPPSSIVEVDHRGEAVPSANTIGGDEVPALPPHGPTAGRGHTPTVPIAVTRG